MDYRASSRKEFIMNNNQTTFKCEEYEYNDRDDLYGNDDNLYHFNCRTCNTKLAHIDRIPEHGHYCTDCKPLLGTQEQVCDNCYMPTHYTKLTIKQYSEPFHICDKCIASK